MHLLQDVRKQQTKSEETIPRAFSRKLLASSLVPDIQQSIQSTNQLNKRTRTFLQQTCKTLLSSCCQFSFTFLVFFKVVILDYFQRTFFMMVNSFYIQQAVFNGQISYK